MIKPIFKTKHSDPELILKLFPKNYTELDYIEPYSNSYIIYFNKEESSTEFLNSCDLGVIQILRSIRDEPKLFMSRLRKTKFCENTFNKALKTKKFNDYMDEAVNEFILRNMSRNGVKKTYSGNRDEETLSGNWNKLIDSLEKVSLRINKTYLSNKSPFELISSFDREDVVLYIEVPNWDSDDAKLIKQHSSLFELLKKNRGKIILNAPTVKFYKKLYKEWNSKIEKLSEKTIFTNY